MVDRENKYVKTFRIVQEQLHHHPDSTVTLRLFRNRTTDARVYNLPSTDELAALIIGDSDATET
jgi:hypothetical protein